MPRYICSVPGCQRTCPPGERQCCPDHTVKAAQGKRQQDRQRGTAHERGYTYRWQRYRETFLRTSPMCARCIAQGVPQLADRGQGNPGHVDHIVPVTGPDDPLFWHVDNHQSLCRDCHRWKTQQADKQLRALYDATGDLEQVKAQWMALMTA